MLDQITPPVIRARPMAALPIADLVLGKPVAEAAELLPRLFNLCRVAQSVAARAAFGLPQQTGWQGALREEILREHLVKLCLKWPAQLALAPLPLPRNWSTDETAPRQMLFGPVGCLPDSYDDFHDQMSEPIGLWPVLYAIAQTFGPGEATRMRLPLTDAARIFADRLQENSVAARHADHPVLRGIERRWGRGPLWSATAVAYDIAAALDDALPVADLSPGRAVVPAARGRYGVTAQVEQGRVTAFHRITPTDHLLAPNGALDQSLATLPQDRAHALAPVVLSILDPCFPVELEPAADQETEYA